MDNVLDAIDMIAETIKNPAQPFSCIRIKLLFLDDLCKELVKQGAKVVAHCGHHESIPP